MTSEYLSRRQFIKRVIIGGGMVVGSTADSYNTMSKLDRLKEDAKKEVIEKGGVTSSNKAKEIHQPEETISQQVVFDKKVKESLSKKTTLFDTARLAVDLAGILAGSALGFNAMYRKSPSYGPSKER